jgi:hypothetical protein
MPDRCPALGRAPPGVVARITVEAEAAVGATPQPVPRLNSSGLLPTDWLAVQSHLARQDFDKVRVLAYGWRLARDSAFLATARDILLGWTKTFRTQANPIDEARLPVLAEGYALLRQDLAKSDRDTIDQWWRGILDRHMDQLRGRQQANNWQSHRIHIATSIAFALEDQVALAELSRHHRTQVLRNIRPDGSTFDFQLRDAIRYAVYTLQPLVEARLLLAETAPLASMHDRDVEARLAAGLDWLVPYAEGWRTHIEFEKRKMPTDHRRAEAGVPGYTGPWDPAGARDLFWLATYLDDSYIAIARRLAPAPSDVLLACRNAPRER